MKDLQMKTATEILEERVEIDCYLCGKGKIIIRAGDIKLVSPHPVDHEMRYQLNKYLLEKTKEFFDTIN